MTGPSRSISGGEAFPSGTSGAGVGLGVAERGAKGFLVGEKAEESCSSSSGDCERILFLSFREGTRTKAPRAGVGGETRGGARPVERKRVGLLK